MSDGEHGPAQVYAVPPVDAVVTVAVGEQAVVRAGVWSGQRVAVHTKPDDEIRGVTDYDGVRPALDGAPGDDPLDSFEPGRDVWVTVTVDDARHGRFTASPGETVALYAEPARADMDDPGEWFSGDETRGKPPEDGGAA